MALERAELEVVGDGHCGEKLATLRHQTKSQRDSLLDTHARGWRTRIADLGARRQQAHDGAEQRRLAGAIGSDDGDDAPLADRERYAVHCLDLAVGDMEIADFKQRAHAWLGALMLGLLGLAAASRTQASRPLPHSRGDERFAP